MAKYLVETYYTCNIKVSHYLDDITEDSLKNLEKREDGKFEIIDIKLDSRKTKNLEKVGSISDSGKQNDSKLNVTSDTKVATTKNTIHLLLNIKNKKLNLLDY